MTGKRISEFRFLKILASKWPGLFLVVTLCACKGTGLFGRSNSNATSAGQFKGALELSSNSSLCKRAVSLDELGKAGTYNLSNEQFVAIYNSIASVLDPRDPVTGFATGLDRLPALARASTKVREEKARIFYVEVDVRNLGGLNLELVTHAAANELFRTMAQTVYDSLSALSEQPTEDLCAYRHGGDEFSFILEPRHKVSEVNKSQTKSMVTQADIERQLGAAQEQIAQAIKSWGPDKRDLSGIIHPKNCVSEELMSALKLSPEQRGQAELLCSPYRGTGIYFGVSEVLGLPAELTAKKEQQCWLTERVIKVADAAMSA